MATLAGSLSGNDFSGVSPFRVYPTVAALLLAPNGNGAEFAYVESPAGLYVWNDMDMAWDNVANSGSTITPFSELLTITATNIFSALSFTPLPGTPFILKVNQVPYTITDGSITIVGTVVTWNYVAPAGFDILTTGWEVEAIYYK